MFLIREYGVVDRLGNGQGKSRSCAIWRWINCLWTKVGRVLSSEWQPWTVLCMWWAWVGLV